MLALVLTLQSNLNYVHIMRIICIQDDWSVNYEYYFR
jgi:hypothetical protein